MITIPNLNLGVHMFKEFKEFAMKGNVLDMAIGIIMGAAFSPIVNSLVKDIIMPPIGVVLGKVDFSGLKLEMVAATDTAPAVTINYGLFLNTVVSFTITAFAVFLLVKAMNKARKKDPAAAPPGPPPAPPQEVLLTEIRDLLKNK